MPSGRSTIPLRRFRETITEVSDRQGLPKSPNKHNRLFCNRAPFGDNYYHYYTDVHDNGGEHSDGVCNMNLPGTTPSHSVAGAAYLPPCTSSTPTATAPQEPTYFSDIQRRQPARDHGRRLRGPPRGWRIQARYVKCGVHTCGDPTVDAVII